MSIRSEASFLNPGALMDARIGSEGLPRRSKEQPCDAVPASGEDQFTVRAERSAADSIWMEESRWDFYGTLPIPNMRRAVQASGDDLLFIGTERGVNDPILMAHGGRGGRSVIGIPNTDITIMRRRDDVLAGGAVDGRANGAGVTNEPVEDLAGVCVIDAGNSIGCGRDKAISSGAEVSGEHLGGVSQVQFATRSSPVPNADGFILRCNENAVCFRIEING